MVIPEDDVLGSVEFAERYELRRFESEGSAKRVCVQCLRCCQTLCILLI